MYWNLKFNIELNLIVPASLKPDGTNIFFSILKEAFLVSTQRPTLLSFPFLQECSVPAYSGDIYQIIILLFIFISKMSYLTFTVYGCKCGGPYYFQFPYKSRIIGGFEARRHSLPFQV